MADYDSPWKTVLERYFAEFLAFFFPEAHAGIDWTQGYTLLDKELQKVVRDAKLGRRWADSLVRVTGTDGQEDWVLVHVEVQGRNEADFAQRMFVYN
ncbi:cytosolic protein, partial [Thioalkalicoccus limnaeus]